MHEVGVFCIQQQALAKMAVDFSSDENQIGKTEVGVVCGESCKSDNMVW